MTPDSMRRDETRKCRSGMVAGVRPQVGGVLRKFVADFVVAWSKVTDLGRYDVA